MERDGRARPRGPGDGGELPRDREKDLGRRFTKELGELRFLERGIALRSDRGEFEEALRLCDVALGLGLGEEYERKRASLLRMT